VDVAENGQRRVGPFARATEDYCEAKRSAALAIDGITDTGWTIKGATGRPHAPGFQFREPSRRPRGGEAAVTLHQENIHQKTIGRFRLSFTRDAAPVAASGLPADLEAILLQPADERSDAEWSRLEQQFLRTAPELAKANEEIAALRRSMPKQPTTMVM